MPFSCSIKYGASCCEICEIDQNTSVDHRCNSSFAVYWLFQRWWNLDYQWHLGSSLNLAEQPLAKIKRLEKIKINGRTIKATLLETGDIRLHLHLVNVPKLEISENGSQIDPATIGVSNVNLQDAAGSYAYHIPQGILLDYQPNVRTSSKRNKNTWQHCSVLDVAPSLLKLYGIEKPSFMKGDNGLFS